MKGKSHLHKRLNIVGNESYTSTVYKEITRTPKVVSSDTVETLVQGIQIQDQHVELSPLIRDTLPVYRPSPKTQWTPTDLCTG
jgi:hypothetical protein